MRPATFLLSCLSKPADPYVLNSQDVLKSTTESFPLPWLLGNLLHVLFSLPPSPLVVHKLTIAFHALFSLQSKAEAAACAPCNQTFNLSAWLPPMGEIDTGVTTCVQKVIMSASVEEMYPEQLFFCSSSMPSIEHWVGRSMSRYAGTLHWNVMKPAP